MPQQPTLHIFMTDHCPGCAEIRRLVPFISKNYPDVNVVIIDMDDPLAVIPDVVFAAPTYMLNGRVFSIGNPSFEEIQTTLSGYMVDAC